MTFSLFPAFRDAGAWSVLEILGVSGGPLVVFGTLERWRVERPRNALHPSSHGQPNPLQPRLGKKIRPGRVVFSLPWLWGILSAAPRRKMRLRAPDVFFVPRRGCRESLQRPAYRKSLQPRLGKSFVATPRRKKEKKRFRRV